MVKLPKKTFEEMLLRYRVSGTFENLNQRYVDELFSKQRTIDKLKDTVDVLNKKVKQLEAFIDGHGLIGAFKEFIKPQSVLKKLDKGKSDIEKEKQIEKTRFVGRRKDKDIAI